MVERRAIEDFFQSRILTYLTSSTPSTVYYLLSTIHLPLLHDGTNKRTNERTNDREPKSLEEPGTILSSLLPPSSLLHRLASFHSVLLSQSYLSIYLDSDHFFFYCTQMMQMQENSWKKFSFIHLATTLRYATLKGEEEGEGKKKPRGWM